MSGPQLELMTQSPAEALLAQLELCEVRSRDGWHEIIYPPTRQIVPGAQVDFHHPTLGKNAPYRPRRFRSPSEARESLERLRADVEAGIVIVEAGQ